MVVLDIPLYYVNWTNDFFLILTLQCCNGFFLYKPLTVMDCDFFLLGWVHISGSAGSKAVHCQVAVPKYTPIVYENIGFIILLLAKTFIILKYLPIW